MFVIPFLALLAFGVWDSGVVGSDGYDSSKWMQQSTTSEFGKLIGTED